jgi:hypothetical protein
VQNLQINHADRLNTRSCTFEENIEMSKVALPFMALAIVALVGCGTTTGERSGSGALMGAAGGALIGSLSGSAGEGALIGAGAGALGGYLYDQHRKGNID